MIRIERNPNRNQLTVFGLLWLVFFGVLGAISWWKNGVYMPAAVFWGIGAAFPAIGLVWPVVLRMVFVGMSFATFPIGVGVSYFILALVYYVILTPIGLIRRFTANDPMERRFDRGGETYWMPRETEEGTERYFKQF